jgi:hypothetical protein
MSKTTTGWQPIDKLQHFVDKSEVGRKLVKKTPDVHTRPNSFIF